MKTSPWARLISSDDAVDQRVADRDQAPRSRRWRRPSARLKPMIERSWWYDQVWPCGVEPGLVPGRQIVDRCSPGLGRAASARIRRPSCRPSCGRDCSGTLQSAPCTGTGLLVADKEVRKERKSRGGRPVQGRPPRRPPRVPQSSRRRAGTPAGLQRLVERQLVRLGRTGRQLVEPVRGERGVTGGVDAERAEHRAEVLGKLEQPLP